MGSVDPALISSPPVSDYSDVTSNPLQSPLDLSHLEDSGELETVVKNKFTFANNNLVKSKPDLSVFDNSKTITRTSLVTFVSPFQRYTLLKPYLESIEKERRDPNENSRSHEDIRIDSIKKHFDKLTEMTPKRVVKKTLIEEDEEKEDDRVLSSDEEVEPKKPYFEDPNKPYVETKEKIPSMRQGAQKSSNHDTPIDLSVKISATTTCFIRPSSPLEETQLSHLPNNPSPISSCSPDDEGIEVDIVEKSDKNRNLLGTSNFEERRDALDLTVSS